MACEVGLQLEGQKSEAGRVYETWGFTGGNVKRVRNFNCGKRGDIQEKLARVPIALGRCGCRCGSRRIKRVVLQAESVSKNLV